MTATMATPLKNFFGPPVVRSVARDLAQAWRGFDERSFLKESLAGLEELELTARGRRLAEALRRHLPSRFPEAAKILIASLGPEFRTSSDFGMAPFRYLPHVFYVGTYGLDHFEPSMKAQYELTKRFTAEWSIRGFLVRHREATLERLADWSGDRNVHVRRLVSEGTRPRLPWAPRLRDFQRDPRPVLRLLERLKDDLERYVQRSVANNLNDIGKDHPDIAADVCRRWSDAATPGRAWIVGHALRSLVKRGHPGALKILGVGARPEVRVSGIRVPPRVRIGDLLRFSFDLAGASRRAQDLMIDYVVRFVKASGRTAPKVFKLRRLRLAPGERVSLKGTISFRSMTTRRPYPGLHRIDLLINGTTRRLGSFEVGGK